MHETAVWKFQGTMLWSLLIGIVFYVVQIASIVLYIKVNHTALPGEDLLDLIAKTANDGNVLSWCAFASAILCTLLIFGIIKLKKGATVKNYLCFHSVPLKEYIQWIKYLVALALVSDAITLLLGKPLVPEVMVDIYASAQPKILIWTAVLVAAPLFEEIFFRGFMVSGLSSSFTGPRGAIVMSAAIWSLIHFQYDLYGLMIVFIIGIFLGIARIKSGSVVLTICLHSLANLFSTLETVFILAN